MDNNQMQNMSNDNVSNRVNNTTTNNKNNNYIPKPKKEKSIIKTCVLVIGILLMMGIIVFGYSIFSSNKLVCESSQGKVTIMYKSNGIIYASSSGYEFDYDDQKQYASQIGIDLYIKEFTNWFGANTDGECTMK